MCVCVCTVSKYKINESLIHLLSKRIPVQTYAKQAMNKFLCQFLVYVCVCVCTNAIDDTYCLYQRMNRYFSSFIESIILWTLEDWEMSDEPWTVDGTVVHYQQNNKRNVKYTQLAGKWHVPRSENFFLQVKKGKNKQIKHEMKEGIRTSVQKPCNFPLFKIQNNNIKWWQFF